MARHSVNRISLGKSMTHLNKKPTTNLEFKNVTAKRTTLLLRNAGRSRLDLCADACGDHCVCVTHCV